MKKILISTGGTGGHVMPALALYDHYKNNFNTFITTDKRGLKFIDRKKLPMSYNKYPQILKNKLMLPFNLVILIFKLFTSLFFLKNTK